MAEKIETVLVVMDDNSIYMAIVIGSILCKLRDSARGIKLYGEEISSSGHTTSPGVEPTETDVRDL